MATLGTITAKLMLENAKFIKGLQEANDSLDSFSRKSGFSSSVVGKLGGVIKNIGAAGFAAFGAGAVTAVGGLTALTIGLTKLSTEASAFPAIQGAFEGLTSSFEGGSDAMLAALQKGSHGMISNIELMRSFNLASQLVSQDFAQKLPEAMQYLGKVSASTGQSMDYMLDSLVKGIGRTSPMILDNLGIQVDMTEAYQEYADSIGKSTDQLTKAEQQTALMNKTMELLAENTKDMPDITENATTKIAQFQATMANLKTELGVAFLPTLTDVLGTLGGIAKSVMPALIPMVSLFGSALQGIATAAEPVIKVLANFATGLGRVAQAFQAGNFQQASTLLSISIGQMAKGLGEHLPGFIQSGTSFIMGIVQGMANSIPALMPVTMQVLAAVLVSLMTGLPQALQIGLQMIINLASGIAGALPMIISTGVQTIISLIGVIMANLPQLIMVGIQVILALVGGVLQAIPQLISAAPQLISAFVNAILQSLPMIITAAYQLGLMLFIGIIQATPQLLKAGWELIVALKDGIWQAAPMIWEAIKGVGETIKGFFQGLGSALKTIGGNLLGALKDGVLKGDWSGFTSIFEGAFDDLTNLSAQGGNAIGSQLAEGLNTGFTSTVPTFENSAITTMSNTTSSLNTLAGQSPMIGSTFASGIQSGFNTQYASFDLDTVNSMTSTIGSLNSIAPQSTQIGSTFASGISSGFDSDFTGISKRMQVDMALLPGLIAADVDSAPIGSNMVSGAHTAFSSDFPGFEMDVVNSMTGAIDLMTEAVDAPSEQVGNEMINGLQTGFASNYPQFYSLVESSATSALNALAPLKDTVSYGQAMMNGVVNGIYAGLPAAIGAAVSAAQQISAAFAANLDIHSPSGVFLGYGENLMRSLASGIDQYSDLPEAAMNQFSAELARSPKPDYDFSGFEQETPNYQQTNYNLTYYGNNREENVRKDFAILQALS